MTDPPSDPYKTLQVDPEAEDEVIVAAYRRLARKYHPDVAPDAASAARMAAINAAWEVIGDPLKRAAFDRDRAVRAALHRRASEAGRVEGSRFGQRPPETVSRDWTSGRSSVGGGFDSSMQTADGTGAAGPPPGQPSGSVLTFGRYARWSLGEIARTDLEYIEWLDRMPIGRPYRDEIDAILRRTGRRRSADAEATDRRGLFRRR
ncbi:MAG TPA: J domain-containing protein [Candidatus Limnocylindrales bacterium]|nr:J domain-containing protein [Candidatus Limnocylindrales bacterium]